MRYELPHSSDTSSTSNNSSYQSFSDSETMGNTYQGEDVNMVQDQSSGIVLLPPNLWSRDYLIYCSGILSEATCSNPDRVAELFATSVTPPATLSSSEETVQLPSSLNIISRPAPPRITPYDGTPGNLRAFCS